MYIVQCPRCLVFRNPDRDPECECSPDLVGETILFPNFLIDEKQYDEVIKFWEGRWKELCDRFKISGWKTPWINNYYGDNTTVRDGDPIFSAINNTTKIGLKLRQIIVSEPVDCSTSFEKSGKNSIYTLTIKFKLTVDTLVKVMSTMTSWVTNGEYFQKKLEKK